MAQRNWRLIAPACDMILKKDPVSVNGIFAEIREMIRDKDVLEIGCGNGFLTENSASDACRYTACDPVGPYLKAARRRNLPQNVFLMQAEGDALPFADREFDAVLIGNLLYADEPERMLREAGRVLKKDGVLVVCVLIRTEAQISGAGLLKLLNLPGIVRRTLLEPQEWRKILMANGWNIREEQVYEGSAGVWLAACAKH